MCHTFKWVCRLQDAKRRKYETEEEKDQLLPKLRDFSRQEYLKKREDVKLQELEDSIRDEEMMFGCVHLDRNGDGHLEIFSARHLPLCRTCVYAVSTRQRHQRAPGCCCACCCLSVTNVALCTLSCSQLHHSSRPPAASVTGALRD